MKDSALSKFFKTLISKIGHTNDFMAIWNNGSKANSNLVQILNGNPAAQYIMENETRDGWSIPVNFNNLKPGLQQFVITVTEDYQPEAPIVGDNITIISSEMLPFLFPSPMKPGIQPTYAKQEAPYNTFVQYTPLNGFDKFFTDENCRKIGYELSEYYVEYKQANNVSPWYANLSPQERVFADPLLGFCRMTGMPSTEAIAKFKMAKPAWGLTALLFFGEMNKKFETAPVWNVFMLLDKKGQLIKIDGTYAITHGPTSELCKHKPFSDFGHPNAIDADSLVAYMSYYFFPTWQTIHWINTGALE